MSSDDLNSISSTLKEQLRADIISSSDTGANKTFLKNIVQDDFPDVDKRIIYKLINEMIITGELFYEERGFVKASCFYPNTAIGIYEAKRQPVPQLVVDYWEKKNNRKYTGKIRSNENA